MKTKVIHYNLSDRARLAGVLSHSDAAKYLAVIASGVILKSKDDGKAKIAIVEIDDEFVNLLSEAENKAMALHVKGLIAVSEERNTPLTWGDRLADRYAVANGADPKALLSAVKKQNERRITELAKAAAPGRQYGQAFARFIGKVANAIHPNRARRMLQLYKLAYM